LTWPAMPLEITCARLLSVLLQNSPNSLTDGTSLTWTVLTWTLRRHGTGQKPIQDNITFGDISIIITWENHGYGLKLLRAETVSYLKATPSIDLRILWFHIIFWIFEFFELKIKLKLCGLVR
jgi:hypothetical protein